MKKIITLCLFALAFATLSFSQIKFAVGTTAPDFTVVDDHGTTQTLYQYTSAGKYVVIDFFAYWCGPCKTTAPIIDQFYKKYGCNGYDVVVLGIEYEGNSAQLAAFEASCTPPLVNAYPTSIGLAPGNGKVVHSLYGISAFPTVCIIGPDKKVVNADVWPISSVSDIENKFPSGKITPHSCGSTGISETITAQEISVYPSPAVNSITIDIENRFNISLINVSTILGNKVLIQPVSGNSKSELNISNLDNGVYFIEIVTDRGVVTKKFIKD